MTAFPLRAGALVCALAVAIGSGCDRGARSPGSKLIRVAGTTSPNMSDVPALVAAQRLVEQGYEIESTHYAQTELAAEALAGGHADVAFGALPTYWAAAARGAPVVTVMEQARNTHLLVASRSIVQCRDLAGRKLALNSLGAIGGAFVRAYIAEAVPGHEARDAHHDRPGQPGGSLPGGRRRCRHAHARARR